MPRLGFNATALDLKLKLNDLRNQISSMKKILVVDDDTHIQRLLIEELEEDGYQVSTTSNGKEALALLMNEYEKPNLVILDLRMAEMNGLDTIDVILKLQFRFPVIIFSSYSSYRNDPSALAANAYVVKSSDLSELKKKVHELV